MADKIDEGGPAFPQHLVETRDGGIECSYDAIDGAGMTLRDYFAAHAPEASDDWLKLQAELDREKNPHGDNYKPARRSWSELRAAWRYQFADAMLKARRA